MRKLLVNESLGWGTAVWFFGYVLGIALFFVLPAALIGWTILPAGLVFAVWVVTTRVDEKRLASYAVVALVWTVIAVAGDYIFIVKAIKPADGYYKLDVFIYYALTLLVPLVVGWWKLSGLAARSLPQHGA
jgi:hypothetical protein